MLAWAIVPGFVDLCTSLPVLRGNLTWDRHSSNVKMLLALYLIPLCPANSCIPVRRATECSVCPLFDRGSLRDVSRHGAADSAVREQQQLLGRRELSLISMTHGTLLTRVLKQGMTALHQHRTSVEIMSTITEACRMDVTSVSRQWRNIQKRKN